MAVIWRKNFEIPRTDFNISSESARAFRGLQNKTVGRYIINESIWVFKNLDNVATYFPKLHLRKIIEETLRVIITKPDKINRVHKKTILYNRKYYALAEKIRKLNLTKLNTKQLWFWHQRLYHWQYLSHGYSLPTTWFVDSDGEDLTKYIIEFIKFKIDKFHLSLEPAIVFSKLTTPKLESFSQKEEVESLKVLRLIKKNRKIIKKFSSSLNSAEMLDWFDSCPSLLKKVIRRHYYRWLWLPYTYLGPAYTLDYYLQIWRGLLKDGVNPDKEIKRILNQSKKLQAEKGNLFKLLKITGKERQIINITSDIIWLKGYRKDCYYHGFYVLDLILAEIGRRTGLSLLQVKYLLPEELPKLFAGNSSLVELANQRMKFSVLYHQDNKIRVLVGDVAKKFLNKHSLEKLSVKKVDEIFGTCACPGRVVGRVSVVNVPADMVKMKKGDIMVSHTTYPALVPAMKLAAGIVSEDGGVTCHAAIVARELQVPCVVGTKIATQVLKDGDRIEVDANKGTIRRI